MYSIITVGDFTFTAGECTFSVGEYTFSVGECRIDPYLFDFSCSCSAKGA